MFIRIYSSKKCSYSDTKINIYLLHASYKIFAQNNVGTISGNYEQDKMMMRIEERTLTEF